jgi:hypothetical protein
MNVHRDQPFSPPLFGNFGNDVAAAEHSVAGSSKAQAGKTKAASLQRFKPHVPKEMVTIMHKHVSAPTQYARRMGFGSHIDALDRRVAVKPIRVPKEFCDGESGNDKC